MQGGLGFAVPFEFLNFAVALNLSVILNEAL